MCLQERNTELREEVRFLEQRRLEEWGPPAGQQRSSSKPSAQRVGCAAASQLKSDSATPRTGSTAAAGPSVPPAPAAQRGRSPETAGQAASGSRSGGGPQHEQQAAARQTAAAEAAARQAAGRGSQAPAPSHAPQVQHSSLPAGDGCNLGERDAAEAEAGYAFDAGQTGEWRGYDDDAPDFTANQQGADEVLYSHATPLTSMSSQQQRQPDASMQGLTLSQAGIVRHCQGAEWATSAPSQSLKRWRADAAVPDGPAAPLRGSAGLSPGHAASRQPASLGRRVWPAAGAPQVDAGDWEADAGSPKAHLQPAAQGKPHLAEGGQSPDVAAMPTTFSWQPLASGRGTRQQGQPPLRPQQPAWCEHEAGAEALSSSWARGQGTPHAALGAEATLHTWAAADRRAAHPQGQQQGGTSADWPGLGQPDGRAEEAQGQERAATDWQGLGQPDGRAHKPQNHDQEWASVDWQGLGQSDRQSQQQEWAAAPPYAAGPDVQAGGGWHGYSHVSEPDAEVAGSLRVADPLAAGASAEQDSLWRQNGFVRKEQSQSADYHNAEAAGSEVAMQQVRGAHTHETL